MVNSVAATPRPAREPLPLRSKLLIVLAGCAAFSGYNALKAWHNDHAFVINATDSLPNWAFLVHLRQFPRRGEYVLFHPGHDPLTVRHFGAKASPFAKIAYGIPGDVVTRAGDQVLVNGHPVARLKPRTKQGEALTPGPTGIVPRGCVFAGSPHKDGFDSRYSAIGFVCSDRLLGVGEAVL